MARTMVSCNAMRLTVAVLVAIVHFIGPLPRNTQAQDAHTDSPPTLVGKWRSTGAMLERREYAGGVSLKD